MLDEFKDEQKIAYQMIKNAKEKNKCSHAYLIETNGYSKKQEFAIVLAKYILCPYNYSNNSLCVNCTQCLKIDRNIFDDVKIIEPEGLWIKKEQLLELQEDFVTKSVLSGKKVYIITDASKLNSSAGNSILKFLEEPNDNIIAILLADNIHQVLKTIVSRCQTIPLTNKIKELSINNFVSFNLENIELIKNSTINFINQIENKKGQALLFTKKYFHNNIVEKEELIVSFEIMMLYYKDALNKKLNRKVELFNDISDTILDESIEIINKKIDAILSLKNKIYINANTNLLIDKLVLELGGLNENSRC